MALTSALFTGLTGLDVNQTRLNVVGNNIANVNTTAFKASRVTFKSQFYVTDSAGSGPDADFGGSNPSQRGLGATVAAIDKSFDPGPIQSTGKSTDLAIDGQGFFVVQSNGQQRFTRDGSFGLNDANDLTNSSGAYVQGYGVDANNNILGGSLGKINIPLGSLTIAQATTSATFQGNLNSNGAPSTAAGAAVYDSTTFDTFAAGAATPLTAVTSGGGAASPFQVGDVISLNGTRGGAALAPGSFTVSATSTVQDFQDFVNHALQIDTTVSSPANVGAQIVNGAGTSSIQITSNTGAANFINSITLTDNRGGANVSPAPVSFSLDPNSPTTGSGESVDSNLLAYDSLGTPINVDVAVVYEGNGASPETGQSGNNWRFYVRSADNVGGNPVVGDGVLTFDTDGKLIGTSGTTINVNRAGTGAAPLQVKLDFSQLTSLTSSSSNLTPQHQDGYPIGTLTGFSIGSDGVITGSFSNSLQRTLGQVAVATFTNPNGLLDEGGNLYSTGADSGLPIVGAPGDNGAGTVRSGALEGSNVDISTEFTNLIIATTGFDASSRVITTSDQLITELLNSNR